MLLRRFFATEIGILSEMMKSESVDNTPKFRATFSIRLKTLHSEIYEQRNVNDQIDFVRMPHRIQSDQRISFKKNSK